MIAIAELVSAAARDQLGYGWWLAASHRCGNNI